MTMYIHMSNTDSLKHYPKNSITRFTVKLPDRLSLSGSGWMCGISQVEFRNIGSVENLNSGEDSTPQPLASLYLASDIIDYTYTGFGKVQMLTRVPIFDITKREGFDNTITSRETCSTVITKVFNPINYTPLRLSEFTDINLYLKGDNWSPIRVTGVGCPPGKVLQPSIYCVLHFVQSYNGKRKICNH